MVRAPVANVRVKGENFLRGALPKPRFSLQATRNGVPHIYKDGVRAAVSERYGRGSGSPIITMVQPAESLVR